MPQRPSEVHLEAIKTVVQKTLQAQGFIRLIFMGKNLGKVIIALT